MHLYLSGALIFLSWLAPLHFPPWISWHSEMLAFLAVFLVAWTAFARRNRAGLSSAIGLPGLCMPFFALGVVAAGQLAMGQITFAGDALVLAQYLFLCVTCLALGFACGGQAPPHSPAELEAGNARGFTVVLAFTLVLGAFFSAIVAFAQTFEVLEWSSWVARVPSSRRPGGNLAQPNQLATLLLMGVASLVYVHKCGKLSSLTALLIFLVLCTALAATESRTGVLSFFLLAVWCLVGRARAGLRLSPWVVVVAGIGFLGLFWAWPSFMSASGGFEPGAEVDTRVGMRMIVWAQLWEAVTLRPWFGWGLLGVPKAHNAVASAYELSEPYGYSHNIVMDLALGVGLPLAALFVLAAAVWLVRSIRSARSPLAWYCLAAALPLTVHSMLEFPFAYAYFLVPVMFLLGVFQAATGGTPLLRLRATPAFAGLLLATIVGAWSAVEYFRIEEDFRVARFEAFRLGKTPTDYARPQVHLLSQLGLLLEGARLAPHPGMSAEEMAVAKNGALRYPVPATQNRYALSLVLNGDENEGLRQLRVLRVMHGESIYGQIKANWAAVADKYPQLRAVAMP